MATRKFGWFRELPDHRDYRFETIRAPVAPVTIPKNADLSALITKVKDQGPVGSCTSQGTTSAFEALQVKRTGSCVYGSRLFNYHWSRVLCGCYPGDNGADIRSAIQATAHPYGIPPEVDMPYSENIDERIPAKATADAKAYESTNYYLLDSPKGYTPTLKNIKESIGVTGLPVVFGTPVFKQIYNVGKTGIIKFPKPNEDSIGGHCMMAFGYRPGYIKVLNSWGDGWGIPFGKFKGGAGELPDKYWTSGLARDNRVIAGESEIKVTF